jgi:hypothetical protein
LAYRAEALLDLPPEQGTQAGEGASAVESVRTALLKRDDALRRAREDLEGARSLASTWEAEVVTAHTQLQRGRVALEEAEGLKTALADKDAALTAAEKQLWQERAARQGAEGQLQQERAALVEARAALEQGRMARKEALDQLRRERAALEEARATLKKQEEEVSRLNGELVQISISHEDQRQSLEEQEASYLKLQREAEETRQSLEVEKKQVEGKFAFVRFLFVDSFSVFLIFPSGIRSHLDLPCSWLPGLRTALGHATTQAETMSEAYNSAEQELGSCGPLLSRPARQSRKVKRKPGARWQVACVPSAGMSRGVCSAPFTWASRRLSAWWGPTTRWTSRPWRRVTLSQSALKMKWRWSARTRLPPLPPRRLLKTSWTSCSPMLQTPASPSLKTPGHRNPFFV